MAFYNLIFNNIDHLKRRILHLLIPLTCTPAFAFEDTSDLDTLRHLDIEDLANIVVVARKREESLQEVPGSISVFINDDIEKLDIKNIEDTYGLVPGLYVTGNFLSPNRDFRQLVIRGVGANSQLEPSVATFIDGVYAPSLAFDFEFLDIERVEVLKGPQGSLFGRNTEGGVLNIITRKPSQDFNSQVSVSGDEFNTRQIALHLNSPLSNNNTLFGRVSALYRETDGFISNHDSVAGSRDTLLENATNVAIPRSFDHRSQSRSEQDQSDTRILNGGLRFLPNDNADILLNADYSKSEGGDQSPGPIADCDCYEVNADNLFDHYSENKGVSMRVNWGFSFAELTSISGWRELTTSVPWDFDGVAEFQGSSRRNNIHDFDTKQSIFSEELRLSSVDTTRFNWLVGLYLFRETNKTDRFYNFPNLDNPNGEEPQQLLDGLWNEQIVDIDRQGYATFGQLSWNINPQLELAIGLRYSNERAEVSALERYCFPLNGFNSVAGGLDTFCSVDQGDWVDFFTPVTDSKSWENVSSSLTSAYVWSQNLMTYFAFAEGFKAGSYQKAPVLVSDVSPISPEKLKSYELGLKGTFLDKRISMTSAAYYIRMSDMQQQSVVIRDDIIASSIGNAVSASAQGFELSARAQISEKIRFTTSYGYIDTQFNDYLIDSGEGIVNRSGDAFPNTPKSTYSLSAEHRLPLDNKHILTSHLQYRFVDDIYVGSSAINVDPTIKVPSWRQLDFRLSLDVEKWNATFFIDNVSDERVVLSRWNSFFAEPNLSFIHDRVLPPRRAGLSFKYNF